MIQRKTKPFCSLRVGNSGLGSKCTNKDLAKHNCQRERQPPQKMVSCQKCRGSNADNAKFCVHCGVKIEIPPPAASAPSFQREYEEEKQRSASLQARLTQLETELRNEKSKTQRLESEVAQLRTTASASARAPASPRTSFILFFLFEFTLKRKKLTIKEKKKCLPYYSAVRFGGSRERARDEACRCREARAAGRSRCSALEIRACGVGAACLLRGLVDGPT